MKKRALFFGFSWWKHKYVKPFFSEFDYLVFINPLLHNHIDLALKKGLADSSAIFIWGKKEFKEVEEYALKHEVPIYRVEDGFIRSIALGSDLTQPYSLVADKRGIYFDPSQESDLEHILNFHTFTSQEIKRARIIRDYIVKCKLSKYNSCKTQKLDIPKDKRVVFVPGQVEDDASIRFGGGGMTNIELLKKVRLNSKDSYIIFKPHPDVVAKNRIGEVARKEALKYCDLVVENISIDSILYYADEVHTITSLVGFEALLRGKRVYTYGMPFYAGWGLTEDFLSCSRRKRRLSLDELTAAAYILYPRYIDPIEKNPCEVETLLNSIDKLKRRYNSDIFYRARMDLRSYFFRKIQQVLKVFRG